MRKINEKRFSDYIVVIQVNGLYLVGLFILCRAYESGYLLLYLHHKRRFGVL